MVGVTVGYKVRILSSSGIVKISPKRIRVVGVVGTPRLVRALVLFWIVSILLGVAAGGIPSDHYWYSGDWQPLSSFDCAVYTHFYADDWGYEAATYGNRNDNYLEGRAESASLWWYFGHGHTDVGGEIPPEL